MYSDERRIAALLRDLMLQSGTPTSAIEFRLGWEPGRLSELLAEGVSFEVLLEVLPALDATPGDFFARLYGYSPAGIDGDSAGGNGHGNGNGSGGNGNGRPKAPDRRFEESRRVVKAAITRRSSWKQERCAT
jgi:hypothetical protein